MIDWVDGFHRHITCRIFGHRMENRIYGVLCKRCRTWRIS